MTDASQRLAELLTGSTTDQALELFDSLPAVGLDQLIGQWRGTGLRTGHVFDGQLEAAGWRGKNFHSTEDVDPLVFEQGGRPFRVNPSLLPLGAGVRYPQLLGRPAVMRTSGRLLPLLKTSKPQARLRMVEYRGVVTGRWSTTHCRSSTTSVRSTPASCWGRWTCVGCPNRSCSCCAARPTDPSRRIRAG